MTPALIVVDAQESFRQRAIWEVNSNPDLIERINCLVELTRDAGGPVLWVLHAEPGTGTVFDPQAGHVRLMSGLRQRPEDPVITKTVHNAFTGSNLQQQLEMHGVTELLISGIRTEQCCETTARVAADLGFDVSFVIDATATTPIEHRDARPGRTVAEILADPLTLSTHDIISRTEYVLAGRFAQIRHVGDLVSECAGNS